MRALASDRPKLLGYDPGKAGTASGSLDPEIVALAKEKGFEFPPPTHKTLP